MCSFQDRGNSPTEPYFGQNISNLAAGAGNKHRAKRAASCKLVELVGRLLCSVSRRALFGAPASGTREGRQRGETEVRESAVVRSAWVSNIAEVVLQRPSGTM